VANKEDVVLEHHVGSSDDTPGGPPCNTSHADYWRDYWRDNGSDDAAGAVDTGGTIDNSVCLICVDSHGCGEGRNAERGEEDQAHHCLLHSIVGWEALARIGSDFCPACNCSSKKYLPRHVQFDTSVLNVPTIYPGSVSRRVISSLDGGEPKARLDLNRRKDLELSTDEKGDAGQTFTSRPEFGGRWTEADYLPMGYTV
jgi:hypothetical protein